MTLPLTEREFQTNVLAYLRLNGWLAYHTHDSRRSQPGFPDILALRGPDIVVAELKGEKGRVSAEQTRWLTAFDQAGVDSYVWRPADWTEVTSVLRRRAA